MGADADDPHVVFLGQEDVLAVVTALGRYVEHVARTSGFVIPPSYPVFGKDAFETGTGVHAAAVIKAFRKNDTWLANRVYSGVPADEFGLHQKIGIGPMSGKSNVIWWLTASSALLTRPSVVSSCNIRLFIESNLIIYCNILSYERQKASTLIEYSLIIAA